MMRSTAEVSGPGTCQALRRAGASSAACPASTAGRKSGISRPVGSNTYSPGWPATRHGRGARHLKAQQPPAVDDELLRAEPADGPAAPAQVGMVECLVERAAGEQCPGRGAQVGEPALRVFW